MEEGKDFGEPILLLITFFGVEAALIGVILARILFVFLSGLSRLFGGFIQPASLTFLYWAIPIGVTIVTVTVILIGWIILVGLTHLSAKYFFKGLGSFDQLLKLYGYSSIVLFLPILGTIFFIIDSKLFIFTLILTFIAIFWLVIVWVAAVELCHKIDSGKAFFSAFVMPLIVCLIVGSGLWFSILTIIGGIFG